MGDFTALVIDDEPDIRELLDITLARMNIDCHVAANLNEARHLLEQTSFDLCLTDMRLPDGNGLDFVDHIQANYSQLPVAVITAHGNVEAAVRALKAGAFDFISKPVDLTQLRALVSSALWQAKSDRPAKEQSKLEAELIGQSRAMQHVRNTVRKLSCNQAPVWISGESGTGKELVARLIHQGGSRAQKAFVPVNCGAIPSELVESEFFGHEKGSFTGAHAHKEGLFRAAEGGTLFLDEVADLPLPMQVKLLRAIQERAVRPVGSQLEQAVDVRILSASHKDLAEEVQAGRFRQDLFYRLNVIELKVPPLRERKEDLPLLVEHLLMRMRQQYGKPNMVFDAQALDRLALHAFPGNIRELENIIERAVALSEYEHIGLHDLRLPELTEPQGNWDENTDLELDQQPVSEKRALLIALEANRWNKTATAKVLGITYRQLRYKLQKFDL